MTSRPRVVVTVAVAALVAGAVTAVVVRRGEPGDASREAATAYVDLVASADSDDLPRLWSMAVTEDPAALRTAGDLLLAAEERVEVVSVGDVETAPDVDVPFRVQLDDFRQVEVTYRLDGEERLWPVRLGRLTGSDGDEVDDWRVVGDIGSIDWAAIPSAIPTDYYVGGSRLVRRPLAGGSDSQVQPLYPAVYRTQTRLGIFYSSQEERVAVLAGDPVGPPQLRLAPTTTTETKVRQQVLADLESCRVPGRFTCPVDALVESRGVDSYGRGWWLGLTQVPTTTVDGDTVVLEGGAFRYRGPDGVRLLSFTGSGRIGIDGATREPAVFDYALEEVR
ncbi:hypothetical protein [Nocardioides sp.]|uniref:hypothetical protein n=1 Tax=Nocardioides sp. TaxID=35761 RepID=UPI002715AF4A|nr:hypothetical protein [Nocardioides sp.]MDO9456799.1 hypothetical protein [Nocardioides sp.]